MELVTFSEVSYGPAPLPKLKTAQECLRRDSLSSSRTQDSGYISDPELSLSPLDFLSPNSKSLAWLEVCANTSAQYLIHRLTSPVTPRPCSM